MCQENTGKTEKRTATSLPCASHGNEYTGKKSTGKSSLPCVKSRGARQPNSVGPACDLTTIDGDGGRCRVFAISTTRQRVLLYRVPAHGKLEGAGPSCQSLLCAAPGTRQRYFLFPVCWITATLPALPRALEHGNVTCSSPCAGTRVASLCILVPSYIAVFAVCKHTATVTINFKFFLFLLIPAVQKFQQNYKKCTENITYLTQI